MTGFATGTQTAGPSPIAMQAAGLTAAQHRAVFYPKRQGLFGSIADAIQSVTQTSAEFARKTNAVIQPVLKEAGQLGQVVEGAGATAEAFGIKGGSKVRAVGHAMTQASNAFSDKSQTMSEGVTAAASGKPLPATLRKKKSKKKQKQAKRASTFRNRQRRANSGSYRKVQTDPRPNVR